MKIYWYLRPHINIICQRFGNYHSVCFLRYTQQRHIKYLFAETTEYVKEEAYFLRKIQTSRVNNSRILKIKNAKFSRDYFYINVNI